MYQFKQLLWLGMMGIALLNSSCTKEDLLSELPTTTTISQNIKTNSEGLVIDGGVEINEAFPSSNDSEPIVYTADGGVEVNETLPGTQTYPLGSCHFTHQATLRLLDCGWMLQLDDRGRLHPVEGMIDFDFQEDTRVRIAFNALEWPPHDCMNEWGIIPIELFCIEEVL